MKRVLTLFLCVAFSFGGTLCCLGQGAVVAAMREHVVYVGFPNPLEVAAYGYPENALTITTSSGQLKKTGTTRYLLTPDSAGVIIITVWGEKGGKKNKISESTFQAKYSRPIIGIAGKQTGFITKEQLLADSGIVVTLPELITVTKYSVAIWHKTTGISPEYNYIGSSFPKELITGFGMLLPGDKIYFDNIYAIDPDGKERPINSMMFTISSH